MNEATLRAVGRLLSPITRRISVMIQRAVIHTLEQNKGRVFVQLKGADGTPFDAELLQQFGLATHPLAGAETTVLALDGDGTHSIAIVAGDHRYRVEVGEGEACLYNHDGAKVHLKKGKIVDIDGDAINLNGPTTINDGLTVHKKITALDLLTAVKSISSDEDVKIAGLSIKAHKHTSSAPGSPTGLPIP